jgi:hypothetical protein
VFSRPQVRELLGKYTLVQLYTDTVPTHFQPTTSAEENRRLLNEKFGTAQLPTYVILKPTPDGGYETAGRYEEGKINNVSAFMDFLRQPLNGNAMVAGAGG